MSPEDKVKRAEAMALRKRIRAQLRAQNKELNARMKAARKQNVLNAARSLYVPGLPLSHATAERAAQIVGLKERPARLAALYYRKMLSKEEKRRSLNPRTRRSR